MYVSSLSLCRQLTDILSVRQTSVDSIISYIFIFSPKNLNIKFEVGILFNSVISMIVLFFPLNYWWQSLLLLSLPIFTQIHHKFLFTDFIFSILLSFNMEIDLFLSYISQWALALNSLVLTEIIKYLFKKKQPCMLQKYPCC